MDQVFAAKAARRGGIVRRKTCDVERLVGRAALLREVRRRGFHMVEVGGQFVILCNNGEMKVHC